MKVYCNENTNIPITQKGRICAEHCVVCHRLLSLTVTFLFSRKRTLIHKFHFKISLRKEGTKISQNLKNRICYISLQIKLREGYQMTDWNWLIWQSLKLFFSSWILQKNCKDFEIWKYSEHFLNIYDLVRSLALLPVGSNIIDINFPLINLTKLRSFQDKVISCCLWGIELTV